MTVEDANAPDNEDEAVAALRGAMEASAAKDKAITSAVETITEALDRLKWATRRNLAVLLALIVIIGYGAHEYQNFDNRSNSNQNLLLCLANDDAILTHDLNLFADTHGDQKHYPNAKSCAYLVTGAHHAPAVQRK